MMKFQFLLPVLFSLGSLCLAQDAAPSASPASAPSKPAASNAISEDLAGVISAKSKVPAACINEILTDTLNSMSFLQNQLCSTYLALSSKQYQALAKHNRDALASTLFKNPEVLSATALALKSISQQQGSSTGTGGSTNLTSKGIASQLLGVATEYGALTESTSAQTTTFAGSLAGVPVALLKKGFLQSCPASLYGLLGKDLPCAPPALIATLSRISYSVGVNSNTANQAQSATISNPSTSTAVPATFFNSGSDLKVTAISGKWIALQGKPSASDITAAYKQVISDHDEDAGHSLALSIGRTEAGNFALIGDRAKKVAEIQGILASSPKPYSKAVIAQAVAKWKEFGTVFVKDLGVSESITPEEAAGNDLLIEFQKFALSYTQSIGQMQATGVALARPAMLTFEYDNNRPLNQPSNSVFRVIYQAKLGQVTLTANGAASIYDSTPLSSIPGSERLRDVQFAGEADRTFSPTIPIVGKTSMTGSGSFYFQDQTSPSILNLTPGMPVSGVSFTGLPSTATQVFAQKGNIAIGQAKLTLGSGSNLKVPISVTYSNRTELVTSPVWRGQIGISYDFDSLFTKR